MKRVCRGIISRPHVIDRVDMFVCCIYRLCYDLSFVDKSEADIRSWMGKQETLLCLVTERKETLEI